MQGYEYLLFLFDAFPLLSKFNSNVRILQNKRKIFFHFGFLNVGKVKPFMATRQTVNRIAIIRIGCCMLCQKQ